MFRNRKMPVLVLACALYGLALSFPFDIADAVERRISPYGTYDARAQFMTPVPVVVRFGSAERTTLVRSSSLELSPAGLHDVQLNAPPDDNLDMDLAEINVFRPLFRYRAAYSKQVNTQRQQFG